MFDNLKKYNLKNSLLKSINLNIKQKSLCLLPIGKWILKEDILLKKINKKRNIYNKFFLNEVNSDIKLTKLFFKKILKEKNMCLFMITRNFKSFLGIIGLSYTNNKFEIYFVLKLKKNQYMDLSLKKLIIWAQTKYKIKNFVVKVFSNNHRAKKLYYKCGFKILSKRYLKKTTINGLSKHLFVKKNISNVKYFYQTLFLRN